MPITMQALGDVRPKPGAYYARELLFCPLTAMKNRSAYYTRVHIVHAILR